MTTGNMLFGPLELVSLATPSGTPLRLTITYNSRNLHQGALGIGWTLNTEQHISTPLTLPTYWSDLDTSSEFTRPTGAAADESAPKLMMPDTAQMSRAMDGANMGFYLASTGGPIQSCPHQLRCPPTAVQPRVVFEDGSTALFDESGAFTGLRDLAGNEQLYFSPGPGDRSLPAASGLMQGSRSVALQFDTAPTSGPANVVATVGSSRIMVSRVLVDAAGFLTDICAPADPLNTSDCLRAPEGTDACRALGLHTLYRFQYMLALADPSASPTRRLTEVTDEACKVVERHAYEPKGALGVVATTSDSARESLSFGFLPNGNAPGLVGGVDVTSFLAPTSSPLPVGSQEETSVISRRTIADGFKRVATVDEGCGCGNSTNRKWGSSADGVPQIGTLDQGLTHSVFAYGDPLLDRFNFHRPVQETRSDQFPGAWPASPASVLTFAYQHPLVRRPTTTTLLTGLNGPRVTILDYDDDDQAHPCREGVTPNPGSTAVPNELPTRSLCRISDAGRVTRLQYDGLGRLKSSEGPDGVPTVYAYYSDSDPDPLRAGLLQSVTRGSATLALTTSFESYHFTGRPTRVVNANLEPTVYEYDLQGRTTLVVAPDGSTTRTEYAAGTKPLKVTLPRNESINTAYDEWGRALDVVWRTPDALGAAVVQRQHRTYDKGGNVLLEETFDATGLPTRQIQRDYDVAHRVTHEYGLPKGTMKTYVYSNGVLTQTIDEAQNVTAFGYDGFGRLRSRSLLVRGLPTNVTSYNYDAMDNLAEVVDANGNHSTYLNDEFGQTREVTTPNSGTTSYSYTADGALDFIQTETQRRANAQLRYTYDGLRRPTAEIYTVFGSNPPVCHPNVSGPPSCTPETFFPLSDTALVTYVYGAAGSHANGRLSTVSFPGGSRNIFYDDAGREMQETASLTGLTTPLTLGRTYYPGGALASLTYPPQTSGTRAPVLEYDLGFDERVSEVRFGGVVLATAVTHYPFGGAIRHLRHGNFLESNFVEDALGRRTELSAGPVNLRYDFEGTGDVHVATETGDVQRVRTYGYDTQRQLTSAVITTAGVTRGATTSVFSETYSYDAVGNRLSKVRNASKSYVSVFDWKGTVGSQVPANDLLRAVVDPPLAGQCVPGDGGTPSGGSAPGRGDGTNGHGCDGHNPDGHRRDDGEGDDCDDDGHGEGGSTRADAGAHVVDAGSPLPICPVRSKHDVRQLEAGWREVVQAAERLLGDAPTLAPEQLSNRLLTVLETLQRWKEKYDVPTPALLAVLAGTKHGGVDFATTLTTYLTRRASGVAFGHEDMELLRTLVELAERAPVQQAVEMDPTWRYTHDANGAVTSVTVEMPAFVVQGVELGPAIHNTGCYRYDARQRLVQVETLSRVGATQVVSTTPPCEDPARATLAVFRYDEANRRVYANVAGRESWELRGPSGELLAEVSGSGQVARAFTYLDGEPLAMVVLKAGTALRPASTPLGCSASGDSSAPGVAVVVALLALALRKRRRAVQVVMFSAMLLTLVGCPGGGAVPDAGPEPTSASGDPIYYFHNDRQGTPIRLTNEAGATVWRAEYRPFGDVERLETDVVGDGGHVEQPLRFAGQYDDALSSILLAQGPYYNWNRSYEPATGRYLSPEPMLGAPKSVRGRAQQGLAVPAYAYALNNPAHYVDTDGTYPWEWRNHDSAGYWSYEGSSSAFPPTCSCNIRLDSKSKGWFNDTCYTLPVDWSLDDASTTDHNSHDCPYGSATNCFSYCYAHANTAWNSWSTGGSLPAGWNKANCARISDGHMTLLGVDDPN